MPGEKLKRNFPPKRGRGRPKKTTVIQKIERMIQERTKALYDLEQSMMEKWGEDWEQESIFEDGPAEGTAE